MKKRYPGEKFLFSTGESILPKDWRNGKAKKDTYLCKSSPDVSLNSKLDYLKATLNQAYSNLKGRGTSEPTKSELRNELEMLLSGGPKVKAPTFFELMEMFISGEITNAGVRRRPATIKSYRTTLKSLRAFEPEMNYPVNYESVTLVFHRKYCDWLIKKNLKPNSIGKHIKNIKSVMNEGLECSYHGNTIFKGRKFAKPSEQSEEIALTYDEVLKIYSLDLSQNRPYEEVRDAFILLCRTGLRYNDMNNLQAHNLLVQDGYTGIKLITEKTKAPTLIPLDELALNVLSRYSNRLSKFPRPKTNQYFNRTIKEILKDAEFTQTGRAQKSPQTELYKLVSAHTGRRSWISWAIMSGMDPATIMTITGHKSSAVFKKYIIQTPEQAAARMDQLNGRMRSVNALKVVNQ